MRLRLVLTLVSAFALLTGLLCVGNAAAAAGPENPPRHLGLVTREAVNVSIFALLGRPDKFHGKRVRFIGVFSRDSKGGYMFPTKELEQIYDAASMIMIPPITTDRVELSHAYLHKFIRVEGDFEWDEQFQQGFLRTINFVEFIEWSPPSR